MSSLFVCLFHTRCISPNHNQSNTIMALALSVIPVRSYKVGYIPQITRAQLKCKFCKREQVAMGGQYFTFLQTTILLNCCTNLKILTLCAPHSFLLSLLFSIDPFLLTCHFLIPVFDSWFTKAEMSYLQLNLNNAPKTSWDIQLCLYTNMFVSTIWSSLAPE